MAPLLTPAVSLPSPLAGAGRGEVGRGCAYREKLATLHSCCRCLKAGGTTWEVVSSLSPEVTKLREMATSRETQQGIPALDSADWEDPFLILFLRICVCPGHVHLCVYVCVCVHAQTLPCTVNPSPLRTHSPGWPWLMLANMPAPGSRHSARTSAPKHMQPSSLCVHWKHCRCTPPPMTLTP